MNSSDQKHMTVIVLVTIFLGLLLIFLVKQGVSEQREIIENPEFAFPEEFDEFFEEPEDIIEHAKFINEENKQENNILKEV